ncbi:estrogen-related receptor gamma-like [Ptychodera flava]|uniref:estrogen-related receptor gamma-like n=1 Tax=Ptychodera flava TaxID=63121 RepID=UPI003969C96B
MANANISIKVEYPSSPEAFPSDSNVSDSQYTQDSNNDRKLNNLGQRSPEAAVTAEKGAFCQLESQKQNLYEQCTSSVPESQSADAGHGSSSRSRNNQRLCLVCGDIASGYHYGVASCEACKAFFKRTVQGNIQYICPAVNECDITKRRRKSCQACRYRKCLQMGMLKEGVRLDRVRGGRQKYHTKRRIDNSELEVHVAVKKEAKENTLISHLIAIEPDKVYAMTEEVQNIEDEEVKVWAILANLANLELVHMIGWAKQIPDFSTLALNDQMTLLQSAWNEILVFGLAYRSVPHQNKLVFSDDFVMDTSDGKAVRLDLLNELTLKLTEKLKTIQINQEEFVLMKALILCNADIMHLEDAASVEKLQDKFFDALHDHINTQHMGEKRRVSHLLMTLPLVRQISSATMQHLSKMMEHKDIPLQQLIKEMIVAKMEKETVQFTEKR